MFDVTYSSALLAGLLSFISPCVLPIVPPYLAYLGGISFSEMTSSGVSSGAYRRIILSAILFVLGFTTVFVALGASAGLVGQSISQYFDTLSVVAGIVISLMGLHFLGILRIDFLYREARFQGPVRLGGYFGAYLMGLAFAFGWTPCVGPVLAAILFMAGAEESAGQGAALLAVYSLGIGIPFIAAAMFIRPFLRWTENFKHHLGKVEKVMGVILVITGILFVTGAMPTIAYWLLETFPELGTIG